ncbi:hypothetical protein P3X46_004173 [Hevea brasiliensis]|uniref:BZIP domain-containing protein n=1 Tax=Hevea brasiliensis TaxID=3981 RepID=A0ABQ9MVY5_HEVBR|nr:uncharacterized protein LOC110646619 [Hevea brasiliensis]KAJ9184447.1 hypothetical protein P3X46_004173 [Hevea brasiliensis]
MDVDTCIVSSSNSSSSSSSGSSSSAMAADRMVRIEIEAAEALADLAHLAMRECGSGDSGGKWGGKGKRGKKRVKSESSPDDCASNPFPDSVHSCPDLAPDQAVVDHQQSKSICRNVVINPTKAELDADATKPIPSCVKSRSSYGGSRSRQNLTEAEKEARRLRRILANRESARQTIRRRQALCEELSKKAADLAWENENLKREKELALKEYQSLDSKNKHLKAQMAKLIKTEVEESSGDLKSVHVEKPTIPAPNCPLLFYNQHPFPPLCWPSMIQSSSPVQSHNGRQNAIVIPSTISMVPNGELDSAQRQQENPMIVNGPRTPLYIVSCPWFFPVPDHGNGSHPQPSLGLKHIQDGTFVNDQCSSSSSSKAAALTVNQLSPLPEKVKLEATGSTEVRVINDLNETPVGFPPDGGGRCLGSHSKETTTSPVMVGSVAVKNENGLQSEFFPHVDGICTKSRQLISAFPGKNQDPFKFPSKKLVDAAAAAEARRRRKELTKFKNLHNRQCRMNC